MSERFHILMVVNTLMSGRFHILMVVTILMSGRVYILMLLLDKWYLHESAYFVINLVMPMPSTCLGEHAPLLKF